MTITIKKFKEITLLIGIICLLSMLLINPEITKKSALEGLLLSSNVIIPSLFPFMVGVLLISKSGILYSLPVPKRFDRFKLPIIIFILSNLGGYPIGAKIISEEYSKGCLNKNNAELLLLSCINAGPSFIILTVGSGILNSTASGLILFAANILSSLVIFICLSKKLCNSAEKSGTSQKFTEVFVNSVADSSTAMLNICGYIVVASTLLGLVNIMEISSAFKSFLSYFLEISNAVVSTKNVYVLSAILGFSSLSIIFQVLHISREFAPSITKVIFSRIVHALLSASFTFILLKIFSIKIETVSNIENRNVVLGNSSVILSIMLIITTAVFIYSLSSKKYCGKINVDIF